MKIELFALFYLVFILVPIFALTFLSPRKRLFNILYILFYLALCLFLTILPIKIERGLIFISCEMGRKFSLDLSIRNIFLNLALCFPLGYILKNKRPIDIFRIGLFMGLIIEILQLILPLSRVFDPIDIYLIGICPLLSQKFYSFTLAVEPIVSKLS